MDEKKIKDKVDKLEKRTITRKEVKDMMVTCAKLQEGTFRNKHAMIDYRLQDIQKDNKQIIKRLDKINGSVAHHSQRLNDLELVNTNEEYLKKHLEKKAEKEVKKETLKKQSWQAIGGQAALVAAFVAIGMFLLDIIKSVLT